MKRRKVISKARSRLNPRKDATAATEIKILKSALKRRKNFSCVINTLERRKK